MIGVGLHKEIEKNFPKIEKFFSPETLLTFAHTQPDDLGIYHFGLGTMIRVKLLRPKGALYKKFAAEGFTDRDEMSMKIISEFYKYIQRKV